MLVHMKDIILNGITNITLRTKDTDVLVILLSFMPQLIELNAAVKIWVDFGSGDNRKTYFINKAHSDLGDTVCLSLPFFHAFTGCDSTSSFFRKSKSNFMEHWNNLSNDMWSNVSSSFQQLSWLPTMDTVRNNYKVIETFVASLYLKSKETMTVNDVRFELYANSSSDNFRELPPSRDALEQHILRSSYQAGWIWGNTLAQQLPPSKLQWGWKTHPSQSGILIKWTGEVVEDRLTTVSMVTATCKCDANRSKCTSCKCARLKLTCLRYCSCKKGCVLRKR